MKRQRREPIVLSQMHPVTLFLVLCGCILVTFGLIHFDSVVGLLRKIISALSPVLAGGVFAYLLNPAVGWLEKRFAKMMGKAIGKHPKLAQVPRALSSFLAVLLFVGTIVLLVAVTSSQVVDGISTFIDNLPYYIEKLSASFEHLLSADNIISKYLNQISENFSATALASGQVDTVDLTQKLLSLLASGAAGTLGFLYSTIVGFIIAIYLLVSKDRFLRQWKQVLYAVCKPKTARWIDEQMTVANDTFGTAVLGKLVDSVIIGMICFIGSSIIGVPYATLISVIIGVTNVIPYFGPIFGAIPCVLLILMENPVKAVYFLIFIVALQQFDANILDPRIVGQSIGLPAFWELFACMLGGGLFGIIGLIIGVPAFAVLYSLIRQIVTERLTERARDGEIDQEFLRDTLCVKDDVQESGLLDEDSIDSPYVQHLIWLEEISEHTKKEKNEENPTAPPSTV